MKSLAILAVFGFATWTTETANFDSDKEGSFPSGWTEATTHGGGRPHWVVHPDITAPTKPNVLAQLSRSAVRYRFPLAIYDKTACKDGEASVEIKLVSGREEQTAGLVWRYQDPENYYVVRANATEDNIVAFVVRHGKAYPIPPAGKPPQTYGVRHPIDEGEWNLLKVAFRGTHFAVYFDHRKVFEADDSAIQQSGKMGLWTKGDTIAYFDDFRINRKN